MSNGVQREWRFYVDDMIGFVEKVIVYRAYLKIVIFLREKGGPTLRSTARRTAVYITYMRRACPVSIANVLGIRARSCQK
jgi:hypothetical protein